MTWKKKNSQDEVNSASWDSYSWNTFEDSQPFDYFYEHDWTPNHFFPYSHNFVDTYDIRPRWIRARHKMPRITPWLMTMSLLGFHRLTNSIGLDHISQELEAPVLPEDSATLSNISPTSNYEKTSFFTTEGAIFEDNVSTKSNHRYPDSNSNGNTGSGKNGRNVDNYLSAINKNSNLNFQNVEEEMEQMYNYNPNHQYKPPMGSNYMNEYAGPAMELMYFWSTVDYEFHDTEARNQAIRDGEYIPENNLPLGLEVWRDKIFITLPRWKKGIPATLVTIPRNSSDKSPKLMPYPSWDWHKLGDCEKLTSVFRMQVDECNRLWVLDSGKIDVTDKAFQLCPPAIFIFDLTTDQLLKKYILREDEVKDDSLFTNIIVDVRYGECTSAVAYASDVWRFGLVVYDLFKDESFRVEHHFFFPDPLASRYDLHGLTFYWTDGIFGIALSPLDINDDKTLFFHPMSSFREFAVPTSTLRSKRTAEANPEKFIPIGKPRAKDYGHSSGSAIDKNGIMFFNMVSRDSVWCWDTRKEYIPQNLGVIGTSNVSLLFPNDVRVDHEQDPNVWVLSNKLPMYLYGYWNTREVNFRIFKANIREAVQNTICDPAYSVPEINQGFDTTC